MTPRTRQRRILVVEDEPTIAESVAARWPPTTTLTAFVVALLVTQALAHGMTSPLREMTAAAGAMARGDYSRRVRASSRDEVGELARAFNQMAADLTRGERATGGGTGLGMAIARWVVELHGGTIAVVDPTAPAGAQGCRIRVTLPRLCRRAAPGPRVRLGSAGPHGRRRPERSLR